ncbi:MAG: phosphoglucosamine mutase [Elusimicrobia bacterium]|nr:MAG: phosphoglucosamine mutase [Elusimicrobiota bacterium]
MSGLFGTDGVRGIPGREALTPGGVRKLARLAAEAFLERTPREDPFVLLGRDTRGSGPALARQLADGFKAAGVRTVDLGVIPTPAVSYLASRRGAAFGVVVSASHNPPEFNGIKFFGPDGKKSSPDVEGEVERRIGKAADPGARGAKPEKDPSGAPEYLDFLRSTVPPHETLEGLRVVFDGSHGAAAAFGAPLLRALGATVFEVGCAPNGRNINTGCGAMETELLCREVVRRRAHCGVAVDGDADRCVLSDERGRLLDGDALIALSALHLREEGLLHGDSVVLTVMSNLGLVDFLRKQGIGSVQVPVGDKHVTEALERGDLMLGGENSGHVVFRRFAPTGDGLLTALQTLAAWRARGGPLSRVRSLYKVYPQLLTNVRVSRRVPLEDLPAFQSELARAERLLRETGRVFVRYSGTEPLLRILVESEDKGLTRVLSGTLAETFKREAEGA